jgi:hypothetical protein
MLDAELQGPGLSNLLAVYGEYGRTRAFLSMNCDVFSVLPENGIYHETTQLDVELQGPGL